MHYQAPYPQTNYGNKPKPNYAPIIVVGVLAVALFWMARPNNNGGGKGGGGDDDGGGGGEVTSLTYPTPSNPSHRERVKPITDALKGSRHAIHLASFYRGVAIQISTEATNSEQARFIHARSGENLARVSPYTAYQPKIHDIAESFMAEVCTRENKKLGTEDKAALKDGFMAIAWACWEASDKTPPAVNYGDSDVVSWENRGGQSGLKMGSEEEFNRLQAISNEVPAGIPGIDPSMTLAQLEEQGMRLKSMQVSARGPPDNPITHGLRFDAAEYKQFAATAPEFADLGYGDTGKGKVRLLYESLLKYDPEAFTEKQTTGDCTSHATRNACDVARAFEIDVLRQHESFVARGATEAIYGHRGHSGQGMSVYRAIQFVQEYGGVALRKTYGRVDLSVYNSTTGTSWGKRGGVPKSLVDEVRGHQVSKATLVKSVEEARDAIYNGYPLVVGSDHSFSSKRDQNGVAARTRQGWAHAMAWVAVDDKRAGGPWFLIQNSWGPWNGGPKGKYDIPEGSFWISAEDARTMIAQKQAVAVGNFNGFAPLPLNNWGFDYLMTKPDASAEDDTVNADPRISWIPPVMAAVARHQITDSRNVDDDDEGGYNPRTCPRRNEKDHLDGWIKNGDGHWSPCPKCNPDGKHPMPRKAKEEMQELQQKLQRINLMTVYYRRESCDFLALSA